MMIFRQ